MITKSGPDPQNLGIYTQCERYQLFMDGWKIGQSQAQQAFETADLSLIETMGELAGWTTRHPPRSYRRITAEQDVADGGLQGEAWRHFITSWRRTGGDRRRIKGYEAAFLNSTRFRDQPKDGFIYNFQWKSQQIWSGFSELMHH